MTPAIQTSTADPVPLPEGIQGIVADWSSDQRAFKNVPWGKAMMLIFLLSDTFILISSSGTMAMAVNFGYRKDRVKTFFLLLITAALGATFVGMQAFEWTKLIMVAIKVIRGDLDHERPGFLTGRKGKYEIVEIMGLYWHFVDLVWVFIFAVFYLW